MEQTEYQEQLCELAQQTPKGRRIVLFGGAGVSTESRIPGFRSVSGLYTEKRCYPPEQIMSHSSFLIRTEQFYDFYKEKVLYPDAELNTVHLVLVILERQGKLSTMITQNVDELHEKAGSKQALSLHGTILKNHCLRCGKFYPLAELLSRPGTVPYCDCGDIIKPDVVLYEEALGSALLTETVRRIVEADLLIAGRTLLAIYSATGLLRYFDGRHLVVINRSTTSAGRDAGSAIQAPIEEVLSKVLEKAR